MLSSNQLIEYEAIIGLRNGDTVDTTGSKRCIACAEDILIDAQLCKHCKTDQRDSKYRVEAEPSENKVETESSKNRAEPEASNSYNSWFFPNAKGEEKPTKPFTSKALLAVVLSVGFLVFLFNSGILSSSQLSAPGLNSAQEERLNKFLSSLSDGYDEELKTVATCVSIYYVGLNETFLDANARSVPMARVQDCAESRNPRMTCGPADDGSGPICGIAGSRTGYSVASVFGAMIGQVDSSAPEAGSVNSGDTNGSGSANGRGTVESDESNRANGSGTTDAKPSEGPTNSEPKPAAPVAWVPTVESIKACSLDAFADGCPNDYSNYEVKPKNTFGVSAQNLVQRMISAGLCGEWPKENKVWSKPKVENGCLRGNSDGLYVATGDAEIWSLIDLPLNGDTIAAGDGWMVFSFSSDLDFMQKVADLLRGEAWQRGF
jgi:hypothetical protein